MILIGGGGHCRSCVSVIESTKAFNIAGIVDFAPPQGDLSAYTYLGDDDCLGEIAPGRDWLITMGSVGPAKVRTMAFEHALALRGAEPVKIVAASAVVARTANIGAGTIVMHHAIVNSSASIGRNCIINNRALVEHDVQVGDHVHVATGAIVNGGCSIGNGVFVGSGSVLKQGIEIGADVWIGMGAVVAHDLKEAGWYVGNPARPLKKVL